MRVRTGLIIGLAMIGAAAAFVLLRPAEAEPPAARPSQPQGTVLLIPGYGGGSGGLERLAADLEQRSISTQIIDIGDGTGDLRTYAVDVRQRARDLVAGGQPAPDLIGFSAGGIIARIAADDSPDLFRKVITLSAPHNGTATADAGALFGQCPPACEQMRTDSVLLDELAEPTYAGDWLSVWSDTDSVIRPPESSELPGVSNYRLQEFCPGTIEHGSVPADPRTLAVVAAFLDQVPLPQECPAA